MTKSIDELLNLVNNKDVKKSKRKPDDKTVMQFISEFNIESGTEAVPNYVIFYYFRMLWNKENNRNKAKRAIFFDTFSRHFPHDRTYVQRYYLLKPGIFDLSEEMLKEAKNYDKTNWSKKPKKVQSRISAVDVQASGGSDRD